MTRSVLACVAALTIVSCSTQPPPAACSTCAGCCDATGTCVTSSPGQCGSGGMTCQACEMGELCVEGRCQRTSTVDAGPHDAGVDAGVMFDGGLDAGSDFDRLVTWLEGDFDNRQQAPTLGKLVERHVCPVPGRPATATSRWLYVENVEVLSDGRRDSYFTRFVELTATAAGGAVSRASRFVPSHPLASNAFAFNGAKDGCARPATLMAVTAANLEYRQGCDVTYVLDGRAAFGASTTGTSCSFPGGYIQTTATITANGISSQDLSVAGGMSSGERFDFVRVTDFRAPDAGP